MSQLIEPPNSVVHLVGREQFRPPSSFDGATCVATVDCVAVGVMSVDDAPTLVGFTEMSEPTDLVPLGTFLVKTEGRLSLRDVSNHVYEDIDVAPGVASVTVWGNDVCEPCELAFEAHAGGEAQTI